MWKKEGWEERITARGVRRKRGMELKIMLMSLKKTIYMRGERGDWAKPEQRMMTNAQKVGFSGGTVSGMRRKEWKRDEEKKGATKRRASHVSPCNISLPLTLPPFPVLFCRTQLLLRLQPFAALDLVLNESQSNLNPQISESYPH